MRLLLKDIATRHEPPVAMSSNIRAGLAATLGVALVGALSAWSDLPLLLAPLGATAGLLFGQPSSPLSQPVNVAGGYLVGTIACEAAFLAFPDAWLAAALAVGATIVVMRAMRVTHPPAAALPILGFGEGVHGLELFIVVLCSSALLISLAILVHAIPPRRQYPLRAGPKD